MHWPQAGLHSIIFKWPPGKKLSRPVVNILVGWGEAKIALRLHKTTMEKAYQRESLNDICNGVYPLTLSLRFHADFYLCTMFSFIPFHVPEDVLFRPFLWLFYQFLYSLTIWFPLHFCLNSNYFNEKEYPFFKMPSRSRSGIAPEIAARSRSKACHDPVKNHAGNPHGNTTGSHKITPESRTDPVREHARIPL